MDRAEFLEAVLNRYAGSHDITRYEEADAPLAAKAEFHEHGVGYMLIRKAEMWSADRHEYSWFYSVPNLTAELFDTCYRQAFDEGMAKVDPKEGHMSSTVSVVFVCDGADEAAMQKVRKTRYRKDFKLGLNGWVSVHTAAIVLGKDLVLANGEGGNEKKFFSSVLHPKIRRHPLRKLIGRLKQKL